MFCQQSWIPSNLFLSILTLLDLSEGFSTTGYGTLEGVRSKEHNVMMVFLFPLGWIPIRVGGREKPSPKTLLC